MLSGLEVIAKVEVQGPGVAAAVRVVHGAAQKRLVLAVENVQIGEQTAGGNGHAGDVHPCGGQIGRLVGDERIVVVEGQVTDRAPLNRQVVGNVAGVNIGL